MRSPMARISMVWLCGLLNLYITGSRAIYCLYSPRPLPHNLLRSQEALPPRWQCILEYGDAKMLWQSTDWKGEFSSSPQQEMPSENDFEEHMERLLNPPVGGEENLLHMEDYNVNMPLLHDPITTTEVQNVIDHQLKAGKGAGPDGVSPGVSKLLPVEWVMFLCTLMISISLTGYPMNWAPARLIMLFRKGNPLDCDNHQGIIVINSAAKMYDYVLNNRMMSWYKPNQEQA